MAQWGIETDADRETVIRTFNHLFFTKPTFKERLKPSKGAQLRSQQTWQPTQAEDADVAAVLVHGGIREMAATHKRNIGTGSELGAVIAMSVESSESRTRAQLWTAEHSNVLFVINAQSDVVKAYSKLLTKTLQEAGFSVSIGKVK